MAKHKRLKPIGDYLYDKGEMIEQMFSSIPIVEIRNMVPISLQGMPLHELKAECLVELLGISDREILNILDGMKERNVSSSESDREGAFVISDDEKKIHGRRIKKEKKDGVRKIKTDRISSEKDECKKSPEKSPSKKKRKSKEIAEVNSKQKKKKKKTTDDRPVSSPSSSRDASKVAVSKKKKDKKVERNMDVPKKKEDDDIVVLDDDSDKEEKREQKSLLDLLELEMRARAIRSLLKKEDSVQAQKRLSEYKDEPDDLIPVEIEPPQIELLSESDEEETVSTKELDTDKNAGTEKINEGISSKQTRDSLHLADDVDNMASCSDQIETGNENSPRATTPYEGQSPKSDMYESSQTAIKDSKEKGKTSLITAGSDLDRSIQSGVSDDVMSTKVDDWVHSSGSAPQFSSVLNQSTSSCVPESKIGTGDGIGPDVNKSASSVGLEKREQTLSSKKDSKKEIDTDHFLVIEGPSVVQVIDGPQKDSSTEMDKPVVETTPSELSCYKCRNMESGDNVVSLTIQEEFQQPTVVDSSQTCLNSDLSKKSETPGARYVVPSLEATGASCEAQLERCSGCLDTSGANLSLHVPAEPSKSTDGIEDELSSQLEDELLDYDYNPVNSYCDKVSEPSFCQNKNSPSRTADCKTLSSENNCCEIHNNTSIFHAVANDDKENDENMIECHLLQASYGCGLGKVTPTSSQTNASFEDQVPSNDLISGSTHQSVEDIVPDNHSLTDYAGHGALSHDSSKKSSLSTDFALRKQLETFKLKGDARTGEFSSSDLLTDPEHGACVPVAVDDTAFLANSSQENRGSMRPTDDLTRHEDHPQTPLDVQENQPLDVCERICLITEPHGVVNCNEYSKKEREDPEEEVSCSEQHQVTIVQAAQSPGFNSGSTDIEKKVSDSLAVDEGISSIGEDHTLPWDALCVTAFGNPSDSNFTMMQGTSATAAKDDQQNERDSGPCQSYTADSDSNVDLSTVVCIEKTAKSEDFGIADSSVGSSSSKKSDVTKEGRSYTAAVAAGSMVENSNSTSFPTPSLEVFPISVDVAEKSQLSVTYVDQSGEAQNSCSRDSNRVDVVEIIDITEGENPDNSDVLCFGEGRVDSDSLEESDNEISVSAALVLEQMNTILNVDADGANDSSGSESCQLSPDANVEIPAEIYSLNSGSSGPASDDEYVSLPVAKRHNTVSEVSDLDDANREGTSGSSNEGTYDSNDGNFSGHNHHKGAIEIVDDSESLCSIESQLEGSKSDDCIAIEPECSRSCGRGVATEKEGSNDCVIVSRPDDLMAGEFVEVLCSEDEGNPGDEASTSVTVRTPTPVSKDSVVVTIIIEDDDGEEEVQVLTEEVPAEILELKDDDEVKSNWTARWLESDNVKKVVKTSKILANVRKQMKMKFKKVEVPKVNKPEPPKEKSAPPLIGSVEEYHRLVEEGVIFSKTTQKDENSDTSNCLIKDSINSSGESPESVFIESKGEGGHQKITQMEKSYKNKSEKSKRKKKLRKSERTNECEDFEKENSFYSLSDPTITKCASDPYAQGTSSIVDQVLLPKGVEEDADQEDGEISDSNKSKVSSDIGSQNNCIEINGKRLSKVVDNSFCHKQQTSRKDAEEDREEGETSEKEEGEISDSEDDSKESQKSSQPKPSPLLNVTSGSKERSRSVSPPSSIPLPGKPPVIGQLTKTPVKQQSNKTHGRNSAAKRFILRNLQLGKKRPTKSKNKKKRKKGAGGGNKKGLGYSSSVPPKKSSLTRSQTKDACKLPPSQIDVFSTLAPAGSSLQTGTGLQSSYPTTYPGSIQPGSSMDQVGQAQNSLVEGSNTAQMYDSYYSWAYSQGLISSANGNYGYGTPESAADPNVYKQWEEYYRKLMEACKVRAEHASAGTLYNVSPSTTEKSGYTWVFDHSTGATQPSQMPTSAESSTDPAAQVPAVGVPSDISEVSQNVTSLTNEMSDKDRFERWQYRYGLKGLLKEHFIPAPAAPSTGAGNQKSQVDNISESQRLKTDD